jgi:hypothetical protein
VKTEPTNAEGSTTLQGDNEKAEATTLLTCNKEEKVILL